MDFTQVKKYFSHHIRAINTKGHHVHSPFLYDFTQNVIYEDNSYYCYSEIEHLRNQLLRQDSEIDVTDYGTRQSSKRKIADIAQNALATTKEAQLLFRIANYIKARNVLELGTSLGITTAYLAMPDSKCKVTTFEGCPNIAKQAKKNWETLKIYDRINCVVGNINNTLKPFLDQSDKLDLIYIDANHTKEATLNYFNLCLPHISENTIIVLDDIYLNAGMAQAWEMIKQQKEVKATIDLFGLGLVFFNRYFIKQHYKMLF